MKDFNRKITWITHLIIIKLWFDKHVEHVELYIHDLKNNYDMIFRFQWLKWHNSWIDWIDEIVKFDTQYYWNKCLHRLSWYVHNHDYTNMTWYELSLSDSIMLSEDNKQSENHEKNEFENDIFR